MTHASRFRWLSAARTHTGLVREINEDACLELPARGLWAVADGMGGHARGDVASRMIVAGLETLAAPASLPEFISGARELLQAVNRQLLAEAIMRDVAIIGSTVIALLAFERQCAWLWAGDSRLYLRRNGGLQLLSRDHSQVEELKARGVLSDEQALHYAAANLITRAVGAADTLELEQAMLDVAPGDTFLLCSDGLSNPVSAHDIGNALALDDCAQAAERLIELALQGGGRDNISAIVVRAEDPGADDSTLLNPTL